MTEEIHSAVRMVMEGNIDAKKVIGVYVRKSNLNKDVLREHAVWVEMLRWA